jgi:prophage regulatory protein
MSEPNSSGVGRVPEIEKLSGYQRSSLYRLEKRGLFPPRIKLGPRAIGWRRSEVLDWLANRPNATPDKSA